MIFSNLSTHIAKWDKFFYQPYMRYLPLFTDLLARDVIVVGGDAAAASKLRLLLRAGANPTVFAETASDEIRDFERQGRVRRQRRCLESDDLAGCALVVVVEAKTGKSKEIAKACRQAGIPVNVVDRPALSTVVMPAIVDKDPILIAIGSSGASPVLVRRVRQMIEAMLPPRLGRLAAFASRYRTAVAAKIPEVGRRRRFWEAFVDGAIARAILDGREPEAADTMLRLINSDQNAKPSPPGTVTLVGVGPGAADLLTLRALRAMQDADVVLHDALITPEILDYVRRDARRIDVGKRKGRQRRSQTAINRLMLIHALKGRRVVRLKGGDPFIFGRGGEEQAFLKNHGIAVDIVPGITAALGAAAAAGIPLTHRDHASSVTFISGHSKESDVAFEAARIGDKRGTLVIYMGVSTAGRIAEALIGDGWPKTTPVAIVERATHAEQRTLKGRLGELSEMVVGEAVASPALIVVGEVAARASADVDAAEPHRLAV